MSWGSASLVLRPRLRLLVWQSVQLAAGERMWSIWISALGGVSAPRGEAASDRLVDHVRLSSDTGDTLVARGYSRSAVLEEGCVVSGWRCPPRVVGCVV